MKNLIRQITCLLALLLVLTSTTSCSLWKRTMEILDEPVSNSNTTPQEEALFGKEYTLSDSDKEAFSKLLEETLQLMQREADEEVLDKKVEEIEDLFYHIADQADLAYVLFCMNQKDKTAEENYLYASEMKSDAYYDYMVMCQTVDASDYAYRDRFFEDWSENDFLQMRQYTEEISAINKKNDAILVEYRSLKSSSDSFDSEVARLYLEMVKNNQALAERFGYSDYFSYAYEAVYERDYSKAELALLRSYVQTYLVPLCQKSFDAFYEGYKALSQEEQMLIGAWMYNDYSDVSGAPVEAYFSSLPASMKDGMGSLLQEDYSVFTDHANAYAGAFTGYFYGDFYPFCYFGPGYQSVFTVIHEAGHFYAADAQEGLDLDLDLAELHSQGNEWLMLEFSKDLLTPACYNVLRVYKLYESLSTVIVSVMIDEFEEKVYTNAAASLEADLAVLEGYMDEICTRYGGKAFIEEYITDISDYWKFVVIESPVYYISYAVSAISSLTLYSMAAEDYTKALSVYNDLTAGELIQDAFLENLQKAGLATPFEESVYVSISQLIQ